MLRQYVYPKFLLKISKACYTELIYLGCCGETNPGIETRVQLWVVLEFDEELCEFGSCVLGQGSIYGSGENFAKESSLKLREGTEVQRWDHLLDKTPVLIASLVGKKQRMLRRMESGKVLIRSSPSSKIGACLIRLVRWSSLDSSSSSSSSSSSETRFLSVLEVGPLSVSPLIEPLLWHSSSIFRWQLLLFYSSLGRLMVPLHSCICNFVPLAVELRSSNFWIIRH